MKKVLTIILDGFGYRDEEDGNAILNANMYSYKSFWDKYPHTTLYASEERVGLLSGQMGNSEVGHMSIGAGRLLKSNLPKIKDFFDDFTIENPSILKLSQHNNGRVHLMGMLSDGNVHSNLDNIICMYHKLIDLGYKEIYFHAITDGRDTKVDVALNFIHRVKDEISEKGVGSIATICGRYYAMDRDTNYDRTKVYYDLITYGKGIEILNIDTAIKNFYEKNITDEFMKPLLLDSNGIIKDGDQLIWMNFRTDRTKQILSCFASNKFDAFPVKRFENLEVYSFFYIDKAIKTNVFIPDEEIENPLGIYLSKLGLKQARIGESEKYPHVTYYFDCCNNSKIENCDKFHIPSPKVATYDLQPEMNVIGVTKKVIDCMEKDYDFIFANFANPDMVGHTGNFEATTRACMAIDVCLSKIIEAAEDNFYTIFLLADHGNAEIMVNEDGTPCTTHTISKVPFIINDLKVSLKDDGDITNVAPTILDYMDISIPSQMTSSSLLEVK